VVEPALAELLRSLDLQQYLQSFTDERYDKLSDVRHLTVEELVADVGIMKGHARRLARHFTLIKEGREARPALNFAQSSSGSTARCCCCCLQLGTLARSHAVTQSHSHTATQQTAVLCAISTHHKKQKAKSAAT
jgi:hypothetical protein